MSREWYKLIIRVGQSMSSRGDLSGYFGDLRSFTMAKTQNNGGKANETPEALITWEN